MSHTAAMQDGELQAPPRPPAGERVSYTVKEFSQMTGISKRIVWELIRQKKLKAVRVGGRRYVRRSEMDRFLKDGEKS